MIKFLKEKFSSMHIDTKGIIVCIVYSLLLVFGEYILRVLNNISLDFNIFESFYVAFFFSISIMLSSWKPLSWFIALFLSFGIMAEFSNLIYFGYWLLPMDIWLTFDRFSEVQEASLSIISHNLISFSIVIITVLITLFLVYYRKYSIKNVFLNYLVLFGLLLFPFKIYFANDTAGRRFKMTDGVALTYLYAASNFTAKILPDEILERSNIKIRLRNKPKIKSKPLIDNIVFIMGKSLSAHYISTLGYKDETTPFLDNQKSDTSSIFRTAFSAALLTDASLPFFFNMIKQPNANQQIMSMNTNLFRLAKEQKYKTSFFSTQSETNIYFMPLLGTKYIDVNKNSSIVSKDIRKSVDDKYLIDFLDTISVKERNFVVLHQRGSHEPYKEKYTADFNKFGNKSLKSQYLNSVLYTRYIINEIVKKTEEKFRKYIIVYTSDHG